MRNSIRGLPIVGAMLGIALPALVIVALGPGPLPGDIGVTQAVQLALHPERGGRFLGGADGIIWPLAPVTILALLLWRRWFDAFWTFVGGGTSVLLGDGILKPIIARPRPTPALVEVHEAAERYGFPSSTTLFAVVLLGMVVYLVARPGNSTSFGPRPSFAFRLILAAAALLLIAVSLSRIYVGAHWASDVLGSWLVGGSWLLLLVHVRHWWYQRSAARA